MKGQWIGQYEGTVDGRLMLNIDEVDNHYEAVAYLNPHNRSIPSSVAYVVTENKLSEQETIAYVNPVDPRTGFQCTWEEIKHLFGPETTHSSQAKVTLKLIEGSLYVDALSDIGVIVKSVLGMPSKSGKSKIIATIKKWDDFKKYVSHFANGQYLFRGQKEPWRLSTSFHRRGRYSMSAFISRDIKQLHQRLSAITSHYFDLRVPEQNGAFFNLLQHHGYPTPLLDWSYSPYVAAFFTF